MTDLDNAASESTDISNTDIENFKNDIQEGLKAQQKQLNNFSTDKIYELSSISSKAGIRSNDKPK